jgi:glycosyltransferase involved in cell wall biosynthesis
MSNAPLLTVFTPTYNRAHTIHRVFDSLCAQALRDFEWLVIDDGSTDGTPELIAKWSKSANFPIRYFKQENSGKHIAHNLAIWKARGELFAPIDSDDALMPGTLERLNRIWNDILASDRCNFSGIWGLCCDRHGNEVGDRYPESPFDTDLREVIFVYRVRGEKCCVWRTDILRQYPFPEIQRTYIPEGTIWLEIAKTYKTRCVNEVCRVYYFDDPNTGATITSGRSLGAHAAGRMHYYVWLLNNNLEYFSSSPEPFLKAAMMLPIVAKHSGQTLRHTLKLLRKSPAKCLVCLEKHCWICCAKVKLHGILRSRVRDEATTSRAHFSAFAMACLPFHTFRRWSVGNGFPLPFGISPRAA